ncbi:SsrA-binding protein SmpB [Candidatus Peregrinibacteria bacterium]|jgi:SsrA-binding protein|nr:SsrA-binding protein SmpB [Candidatus Peregrinibacteria bacterium]
MKEIAKNKKAYFDYEILEEYESGIILTGAEIKSIRGGNVNLKGSYVGETEGKLAVKNMHISVYAAIQTPQEPTRERFLLLHKKEIDKIQGKLKERGLAVIPLRLYLKKGYAKLSIGICRGKKNHDKRQTLKRKDQDMEVKRALKKY